MQEWQNKFDGLKGQFLERSEERLEAIRVLIEHLATRSQDPNLLKEIRQQFHWFSGSGGVYGFEQVSRYGMHGEEMCDALLSKQRPVQVQDAERMLQLLVLIQDNIESNAKAGVAANTGSAANAGVKKMPISQNESFSSTNSNSTNSQNNLFRNSTVLYFVESNQTALHGFTRKLEDRGVHIHACMTCSSARDSIMRRMPDSMVISLPLPDGNGYELCSLVRSLPGGERTPVIFLGRQAGFIDKVQAIRAGADAFYEFPIDEEEILRKIEHLMERDRPDKFKILSVEDDPDQAEFIKLTLESAGYSVLSLEDPTKFEDTFLKFEPDLVLLDVMLGPMTGFELAQYIRQKDRYATLPVIFLTTENALEMHIRSARVGGDDHLIKPIAPQLLAAAVGGRLEKARTLKKLIDRDGLTGCLTFGAFMERVREYAQPDSHRFSLSLLLFDIDSMHIINDRFGYAVGDKVISTLGSLLIKNFRNAALIGRIAGDRFAVVLENLEDVQIERLCKQVIQDFTNIQQYSPKGPFRSTMSIAFASHHHDMDHKAWLAAAEKLLLNAKEQGGNQVASDACDWGGVRR